MKTFNEQVISNVSFNNDEEQGFMCAFLTSIAKESSGFDFVLDFLGDPEKNLIKSFVESLSFIETSELRQLIQIM